MIRIKKRVLHIITKGEWAGAQKVVFEIVKKIKEHYSTEFEVEVAVGVNGPLVDELRKIGIRVHILKHLKWEISPLEDLKSIVELRRLIIKNKYDVVHLHSAKASFIGRIAAKLAGVRNIIFTVHGWWYIERFSGLKKAVILAIERIFTRLCTYLVLINKNDLSYAEKNKLGKRSQYRLIYNDVSVPEVEKGVLRQKLNVGPDTKIIGNVGRLAKPKNPFRFLEIARKVLEKDSSFLFVWIGNGSLRDKLDSFEFDKERVKFLGFIKEPYEYVKDFDLFLLTSDLEGTPLTIIEALKLGVPVISTDVGGVSEIIGKENTFDVDHIETAIKKILNWDFERNIFYKYQDMVEKYVELYRM